MKTIVKPLQQEWANLCQRPIQRNNEITPIVNAVLQNVKSNGDTALKEYSLKFDQCQLDEIALSIDESSFAEVSQELKDAIDIAYQNIYKFHTAQKEDFGIIETTEGVQCWRKSIGIQKVGLYIPGGTAPLFSTVLMLGIPAKIAGCQELILCTPANSKGEVNQAILYAAYKVGIKKIYRVGGAQAIAAMTYGTETVPKVDKIFGPGNQYVTKAKELAQMEGIAIDMPAGPSELLVIADQNSNPNYVAADLLSQAEHGTDSQVVVVTDTQTKAKAVEEACKEQLEQLPRKDIAQEALKKSLIIILENLDECMNFSNLYAPEHLIINTQNAEVLAEKVINAGSVFIGEYSCESAGDYASGTNHTLPTNGFAKNYSGLSLDSFIKKITFQKISAKGIQNIGPAIEYMAAAEALDAHKNAVTLRLQDLA